MIPDDPARFMPQEASYWLARLCEANYRKLWRLLPNLMRPGSSTITSHASAPALHYTLLEQAPHTLTLHLTHLFEHENGHQRLPDMRIRLYLDAEAAEVLEDCARPGVFATFAHSGSPAEILAYKWRMNYFLHRWLDFCLRQHDGLPDHGGVPS